MANANPAQTMEQVSVHWSEFRKFKGKASTGGMKTHHNMTLKQADRKGIIRLDEEGKIVEIIEKSTVINLPSTLRPEDVYAISFYKQLTR